MNPIKYKPILLSIEPEQQLFRSPKAAGKSFLPTRDRSAHANKLRSELSQAIQIAFSEVAQQEEKRTGTYLDLKISDNTPDVLSAIDAKDGSVRLCNIREVKASEQQDDLWATVWFSDKQQDKLKEKIDKYETENSPSGQPRFQNQLARIDEINCAKVCSFWQDKPDLLPGEKKKWCEVWLSTTDRNYLQSFESILQNQGIVVKTGQLEFPNRTVKLIEATELDLLFLIQRFDEIAEFRSATTTVAFWEELKANEQAQWVDDILSRLVVDKNSNVAACVLDTGVTSEHKLLSPLMDFCLAADDEWGSDDHQGHGTASAGMVAYGDLSSVMQSTTPVVIPFRVDSVKLLPPPPPRFKETKPELWGLKTQDSINKSIIEDPLKFFIYNCSCTAPGEHRGRPTSWSAAIDRIIFENRLLFIQAAGNVKGGTSDYLNYPDATLTTSIEDPAQSWNALTVGAYTQLTNITDPSLANHVPVAQANEISPFTTSSLTWQSDWPIKPDIVMEGGNVASDQASWAGTCDDLSLISTYSRPTERPFTPFHMTSAATALATNFLAKLKVDFPKLEAEALRGLIVHSAEWSKEMIKQLSVNVQQKREVGKLMRVCGYGIPNYDRATRCAQNTLTLLIQREVQPFRLENNQAKINKVDVFDLPWPVDILESLGETQVQMRVTLSYFVEPSPGERGWKSRYRYSSFGLEFDINSPLEDKEGFIKRINKIAREEDYESSNLSTSAYWLIGSQLRNKGSIQSDIWKGSAADLAHSHYIAVYPKGGWWKDRPREARVESKAHYALIVTITTPEKDVDIYLPIAQQVGILTPIEISTGF